MRRIATLAVTTGLAVSCMGVLATSADAATGTWKTKNGYSSVYASGKYSRSASKVTVTGSIYDQKKNGYAPGVQFMAREKGKKDHYSSVIVLVQYVNGVKRYYDANSGGGYVGTLFTSTNTDRLYVRECGYNIKTKKAACGSKSDWKRIYKVR
ncbi:hypothetical protein [Actinomadura parmotrematis]|uniref:DUF2147 domain-containing protein n=1 Tax=Actinomadura parmotrematis TaxID=2864039 RepID=A0ABS7FW55_9ACTN|nr:hypothetical protein [Actinomadura parmotrematis]MBW8483909.1 hypothetical protein [Actinomadura parmotrematis]